MACNMPKRIANKENSDRIKDFMEQNPTLSIRRAENDLEIPRTTVGFYTFSDLILNLNSNFKFPPLIFSIFFTQIQKQLKRDKFHFYMPAESQALEPHHELDRKLFCKWVLEKLEQDENFIQKIFFSRSQIKHY